MMMEKTRMPKGSRRLRPTGKRLFRAFRRHCTRRFVDQTMRVQSRSKAESTREAISEREEE